MAFFTKHKNPNICKEPQRLHTNSKAILKKNKAAGIITNGKLYYSDQHSMILALNQTYRVMEQKQEPTNKPSHMWSSNT